MKSLIMFYSYSGNTRKIAESIGKIVGGDLAEVIPVNPYPEDYDACVNQAEKEARDGFEPAIRPLAAQPRDYDTIFLGTPVWWYTVAPPVRTVLAANAWKGKTVYPFATHGGGLGSTFEDVRTFCAGAEVMRGLDVYFNGASSRKGEADIREWLADAK